MDTAAQRQLDAMCDQFDRQPGAGLPELATLLTTAPANLREPAARALIERFFARCLARNEPLDVSGVAIQLAVPQSLVAEARQFAMRNTPTAHASSTPAFETWRGRYRFLRPLGKGGFGRVGLFADKNLGREVAIKLALSPRDTGMSDPFLVEARKMCAVESARVVRVYDVGRLWDDVPFHCEDPADPHFAAERPAIVMEFAARGGLRDRLGTRWDPRNVRHDFAPMVEGVRDIHQKGLLHCDLKPANILFGAENLPRISDFGLATHWYQHAPQRLGGTKLYMSPEVLSAFSAHRPVDPQPGQDIYSLGVILYEMLTGKHPFRDHTDWERRILCGDYAPVHVMVPQLDPAWQELIARCLHLDPTRRYASADELLDALAKIDHGGPVVPPRPPGRARLGEDSASSSSEHSVPRGERADPRVAELFIGHEDDLAWLDGAFAWELAADQPARVALLHGMAGAGKTYLVDRWCWLRAQAARQSHQPESLVVSLPLDRRETSTAALLRDRLAARLKLPAGDQSALLRRALSGGVLRIENVDSPGALHAAAELVRELDGCRVIIASRSFERGALPRGWQEREIKRLPSDQQEQLFRKELGPEWDQLPATARAALLQRTAGLPLAIHLAAGYLLSGHPAERLVGRLTRLTLLDAADPRSGQAVLLAIAEESIAALQERLARQPWLDAPQLLTGFHRLGLAEPSGVGRSLAAAITGLAEDDLDDLLREASALHLVDWMEAGPTAGPPSGSSPPERFQLHPLLAEQLAASADRVEVDAAITDWFCERLPEEGDTGGSSRWNEIHGEFDALVHWLQRVPDDPETLVQIERAGSWFAMLNGPFGPWVGLCERGLTASDDPVDRSNFLWTLGQCAYNHGAPDRALAAAQQMANLDGERGASREQALALGLQADVLEARGELDEALRIRREEELPVYEQLGDRRSKAVTMGKIADVLQARGELDEALRIRREEELPVYEQLGAVRDSLIGRANLAKILLARAAPGDRDEAATLLQQAHAVAVRMQLPEAVQICEIQEQYGLPTEP